jgi:hypothetical protein
VIEVKSSYIHRGTYVNAAGALAPVTLRYRGTAGAFLENTFLGSMLAPSAGLTLGGMGGARFEGTFFGKNLELRPEVPITVPTTSSMLVLSSDMAPPFPVPSQENPPDLGEIARDGDHRVAPQAASEREAPAGEGGCSVARPGRPLGALILALIAIVLSMRRREHGLTVPCRAARPS